MKGGARPGSGRKSKISLIRKNFQDYYSDKDIKVLMDEIKEIRQIIEEVKDGRLVV